MDGQTKIIAVAGKGGVGKTSLSAVIVKLLVENFPDKKILAIDADPAIGLSTALGVEPTKTIDDVRRETAEQTQNGKISPLEILGNAEYSVDEAICTQNGFAFIAIGRPESAGCYCKINTYLKDVIALIAKRYDFVVIDGEAGIEQINRRVMEKVTHLLLITDQSKKGRDVPFARIAIVLLDENAEQNFDKEQQVYRILRDVEYKRYKVNPDGYMIRVNTNLLREGGRVSKDERQKAYPFPTSVQYS